MIRMATVADIVDIAAISECSFYKGWSLEDIAGTIDQSQALVMVYEESGAILGYVIFYFAADEGEIASIAVTKEARRKGIAKGLLKSLMNESRRRGVRKIFLEVREHNHPAKELYRIHGFLQVGERPNYYSDPKEDAHLLMCLVPEV